MRTGKKNWKQFLPEHQPQYIEPLYAVITIHINRELKADEISLPITNNFVQRVIRLTLLNNNIRN
jgi:hypothetical protein